MADSQSCSELDKQESSSSPHCSTPGNNRDVIYTARHYHPLIRRSIAQKKKAASWEALADRVNREDPRFGLRLGSYKIVEKIGRGGWQRFIRQCLSPHF